MRALLHLSACGASCLLSPPPLGAHTSRRPARATVVAVDADAVLFTAALAGAAYFSGYGTEGYEPHRL